MGMGRERRGRGGGWTQSKGGCYAGFIRGGEKKEAGEEVREERRRQTRRRSELKRREGRRNQLELNVPPGNH